MPAPALATARLILRPWRDEDLAAFARLNADPQVMAYFPKLLSREESDAFAARIRVGMTQNPFGLWALEAPGVKEFIGFVGLARPAFSAPFTPCIEVGWRLARDHWGQGYATEAAGAALGYAFRLPNITEIVSFTVPDNRRSRAVMERLGMRHDPAEDFDHPALAEKDPLRRHVLYRISRSAWLNRI